MKAKKLLAVGTLAAAALVALSGCELGGASTYHYRDPYQVATETGTEGTTAEWLAGNSSVPTEARRRYEEARADGYTGTYPEFLKTIGAADPSVPVNAALLSVVDVYANFERAGENSRETTKYASIGSGVIYDLNKAEGDAYIVTNYHIVYNATSLGTESVAHVSDEILLLLYGSEYEEMAIPASYVGGSMEYDVAVLRVEDSAVLRESDARAITPADSDAVSVGQRVYAVGNPDNRGISAVEGIISVDAEYLDGITAADGVTKLELLELRTDAAVNHGNSGGGLFNEDGALLGIVNARSEKTGVYHFGYAVPSNLALAVAQNIIDNSRVNGSRGSLRATLGVTVQVAKSRACFDERTGKVYIMETVAVVEVTSGGLCDGKLKAGDVICALRIGDGPAKDITRMHMLGNTLFRVRKGNEVTLTVSRAEETLEFVLEFGDDANFTPFL